MLLLTIRTDKPKSELGLYENDTQIAYVVWEAHRRLAETINHKITELLSSHNKQLEDLSGIVIYKGPGSFTGLRIGISVANALAYSQNLPIVAETDEWIESGIARILRGETDKVPLPEYGAPVQITTPKK